MLFRSGRFLGSVPGGQRGLDACQLWRVKGQRTLGACCLAVKTLTFRQLMGFSMKPLKVELLAGEQKAAEQPYVATCCFCLWLWRHVYMLHRQQLTDRATTV